MRKLYIFVLLSVFAILITSCSKESQIEGLIATKPTVVEINIEVGKGLIKNIPVNINDTEVNLQVNNAYLTNGVTETRYCLFTVQGNAGLFPSNNSFILKAEAGAELSSSLFNYVAYNGYLFYTSNPINTSNYTYTNTNEIQYGGNYNVPIKFIFNNNLSAPIYAYMEITVGVDKLTINKVVYNKSGSLAAGEE